MSPLSENEGKVWERTPLIFSESLSAQLGANIYLKMESLQPSQCFKQRTIGFRAQEIYSQPEHGPGKTHLVMASSGNAALSLAQAASRLEGAKCSVFVTEDAGTPQVLEVFARYGANAVVYGKKYPDALEKAKEFVEANPDAVMIPAYDHPTLWQGSSSMIDEIAEQLPPGSTPPDAIVCSVGGGSLIGGMMIGCDRQQWAQTRIVAVEPIGSDTLYHSVHLNESPDHLKELAPGTDIVNNEEHSVQLVTKIPTSIATSLGARITAAAIVKKILARRKEDKSLVTCVDISDEVAMKGCLGFADDHKTVVDIACGASLGMAYIPKLFNHIFAKELTSSKAHKPTVVFIVCGGSKVSLKDMFNYQKHIDVETAGRTPFKAFVDKEEIVLA
ncbi:tryptophan synthase beta subunit-like PLP-dependent enzyme [Clavulina sp. PMI_390]|nr:tryptophan synthase beta subunit-like PLP-dependent enzyme [Clavulina sp. PMI_390]